MMESNHEMVIKPEPDEDLEFLASVHAEVKRARKKFPSPNKNLAALIEEVGELSKALLEESNERVYKEAAQVAAMALRVATEGDPALGRCLTKHDPGIKYRWGRVVTASELVQDIRGGPFRVLERPHISPDSVGTYVYIVESELFDELDFGEKIPEYTLTQETDKNGNAEWSADKT